MADRFLLGVLGGMGPLATVDLLQKLVDATPAQSDQQHLPVVAWNVPQVPDRQLALAGRGVSPLPALKYGIEQLNRLAVSHIVIACNTAHHWYPSLAAASRAPILHIADVTAASVARLQPRPQRVGLIATRATLDAGWFTRRFADSGIETLLPEPDEVSNWFVPGCYAVKRGALMEGGQLLHLQAAALVARGAERLILACTEVPPALNAVASSLQSIAVDPARALAEACVAHWLAVRED